MVSTPLKNISQIGNLPQIGVNIKNVWNHHPVFPLPFLQPTHTYPMVTTLPPPSWHARRSPKSSTAKPTPTTANTATVRGRPIHRHVRKLGTKKSTCEILSLIVCTYHICSGSTCHGYYCMCIYLVCNMYLQRVIVIVILILWYVRITCMSRTSVISGARNIKMCRTPNCQVSDYRWSSDICSKI